MKEIALQIISIKDKNMGEKIAFDVEKVVGIFH